jgi:hypothetical protein
MPGRRDRHRGGGVAWHPDHRDVVERGDALPGHHAVDGEPGLDREILGVDGRQRVGQVRHVHLGQEPEFAQVDAEHRGVPPVRQPHRAQHRAVPAE